nr:unnamed protein product [Meloidogyne enterolobii]
MLFGMDPSLPNSFPSKQGGEGQGILPFQTASFSPTLLGLGSGRRCWGGGENVGKRRLFGGIMEMGVEGGGEGGGTQKIEESLRNEDGGRSPIFILFYFIVYYLFSHHLLFYFFIVTITAVNKKIYFL